MEVTDKMYLYPPKPLYVPANSEVFNKLDNDPNWIGEVKKNGWRMMVRVTIDNKIELWTRRKTVELQPLPNLRKELAALNLPPDTILDGELLEHRGQTREHMMLWGMFRWAGDWVKVPYKEVIWRMSFVPNTTYISRPKTTLEGKRKFYEEVIKESEENEGLVLKRLDASVPFSFTSCATTRSWLKVKPSP